MLLRGIVQIEFIFNVKMIFITPHSAHVVACSWLIMGRPPWLLAMMARGNKLANCCVVLRDRERREVQTFTLSLLVNGHGSWRSWSFVTHTQGDTEAAKRYSDYGTWITAKCLLKAPTLQWPGGWLLARCWGRVRGRMVAPGRRGAEAGHLHQSAWPPPPVSSPRPAG